MLQFCKSNQGHNGDQQDDGNHHRVGIDVFHQYAWVKREFEIFSHGISIKNRLINHRLQKAFQRQAGGKGFPPEAFPGEAS